MDIYTRKQEWLLQYIQRYALVNIAFLVSPGGVTVSVLWVVLESARAYVPASTTDYCNQCKYVLTTFSCMKAVPLCYRVQVHPGKKCKDIVLSEWQPARR